MQGGITATHDSAAAAATAVLFGVPRLHIKKGVALVYNPLGLSLESSLICPFGNVFYYTQLEDATHSSNFTLTLTLPPFPGRKVRMLSEGLSTFHRFLQTALRLSP